MGILQGDSDFYNLDTIWSITFCRLKKKTVKFYTLELKWEKEKSRKS